MGLPSLGRRGEGWVVGQLVLIAAVLLSAFAGRGWSGGYAVAGYAVGGTLLGLGLVLLASGAVALGPALTPLPAPRAETALTASGPYRLVRHPMYGGGMLFAAGWTILFASVVGAALTLALVLFLELKSRREEAWLGEQHPGYAVYAKRTRRRFIPFVY